MKRLGLFLLLGLAACGGKVEEGSTDPTSSGSVPTATPTPTTTSVPPSPGSPGSPGDPTPPSPPKDPAPVSKKVITAQALPGGRDHLMIFAADESADSCVRIHLAYPSGKPEYGSVVTPTEWGTENVVRQKGAKTCAPGKPSAASAADRATDAKGNITFGPIATYVYPCTIDVHVAAIFTNNPTVEQIDGDKIAVEGCQ
jgi:hypothetical protein